MKKGYKIFYFAAGVVSIGISIVAVFHGSWGPAIYFLLVGDILFGLSERID